MYFGISDVSHSTDFTHLLQNHILNIRKGLGIAEAYLEPNWRFYLPFFRQCKNKYTSLRNLVLL